MVSKASQMIHGKITRIGRVTSCHLTLLPCLFFAYINEGGRAPFGLAVASPSNPRFQAFFGLQGKTLGTRLSTQFKKFLSPRF